MATATTASGTPRSLRTFVRSHVGNVRRHNEDACAISASDGLVTEWQGGLPGHGGWAIVADGLGGHAAGEVASALAIEILRPLMAGLRDHDDVAPAIEKADAGLYLAMREVPKTQGMGTTFAGIVLLGSQVLAFNVGDSRIYTLRADTLAQVSADDVAPGNLLTQCLGGGQAKLRLVPHIVGLAAEPEMILLLCSDGLTDMLSDREIAAVLLGRPKDPAAALVDAALHAGGHDNASVVVIDWR